MIVGLFFAFLIAAMGAGVVAVMQAEGDKISAALAGNSRPDPVVRPVTVSWEKPAPKAVTPRSAPLAVAA